jgi:hypothetical protein
MPRYTVPISLVDDANPGVVIPTTAVVDDVTLDYGWYKIAAMGEPLLWKLGPTDVTVTTGSYLAAGDQELISVLADGTKFSFILSSEAAADGEINIVFAGNGVMPGSAPHNYGAP